jgi:hypothetical protein
MLCRMLQVSRSGYYARQRRPPSPPALEDSRLGTLIMASHWEGRGMYGSPRILAGRQTVRVMPTSTLVGHLSLKKTAG